MIEIQNSNLKRIDWLDILKGFAILWLIVYHFYALDWLLSPVPVFFLVSGIFYKDYDSFSVFIKKKVKSLIVPFLFFLVLGYVVKYVSCLIEGQGNVMGGGILKLFTLIPSTSVHKNPLGVGAIWFLLSLFEINIFYYVLRIITKNKYLLLFISFFCIIVASFLLQDWAMGSLAYSINSLQFVFYFVIGHLFKKVWLNIDQYVWLIIVACGLCLLRLINVESSCFGTVFTDIRDKFFFVGVIMALMFLTNKISSFSNKPYIKSVIQFLKFEGKNSLTILGTHLLAMSFVTVVLRQISLGVFFYPVLFILICILCNACIYIFNRYTPFLVNKN